MTKLPVKALPLNDDGRLLVRLNHKYREGVPRYGIVSLINSANDQKAIVLMLGHENDGAIFMPYDIRIALGINKGEQLELRIQKVGPLGKLRWLLGSPDPAVYLPAWIAVISLVLAVIGVIS